MHFHGWRGGLKTGMYYLRTTPATYAMPPAEFGTPPAIRLEDYDDVFGDLQINACTDVNLPDCEACQA